MSVSTLVVDDKPDMALLFRQRFRREVREGTFVMHFANSGEDALRQLGSGIEPQLIVILSNVNMPGMGRLELLGKVEQRFPDMPVMMMVTAYSLVVMPGHVGTDAITNLMKILRGSETAIDVSAARRRFAARGLGVARSARER